MLLREYGGAARPLLRMNGRVHASLIGVRRGGISKRLNGALRLMRRLEGVTDAAHVTPRRGMSLS